MMNKGDGFILKLEYTINGQSIKENQFEEIEFSLGSLRFYLSKGDIYWDNGAYKIKLSQEQTFKLKSIEPYQIRFKRIGSEPFSSTIKQFKIGEVISQKVI